MKLEIKDNIIIMYDSIFMTFCKWLLGQKTNRWLEGWGERLSTKEQLKGSLGERDCFVWYCAGWIYNYMPLSKPMGLYTTKNKFHYIQILKINQGWRTQNGMQIVTNESDFITNEWNNHI